MRVLRRAPKLYRELCGEGVAGDFMDWVNAYALAAVGSRIVEMGLTPNRYAVAGWNATTLIILGAMLWHQLRGPREQWVERLHTSIALGAALAAVWAVWVCLVLPLSFPE